MMKLLRKIGATSKIKLSLAIFTSIFAYYLFLAPSTFTSQMIISIKEDKTNQQINALNPFPALGGQSTFEIYQLKEYLESKKAFQNFMLELEEASIRSEDLKPSKFYFFQRTLASKPRSIADIISIKINDRSKTIEFNTKTFKSDLSHKINLVLIVNLYNYFNLQNKLNSTITSTNSMCDILSLSNNSVSNSRYLVSDLLLEFETGSELLINIAEKQLENCKKERLDNDEDINNENIYPKRILTAISADVKTELLNKFYENSIAQNFVSDKIKIISEPTIPGSSDSKNVILNTVITFLMIMFIFFTFNLVVKLNKEYT
jgi:capsule polysaccharide export protein KpsE/RkpR